MAAVQKEVLSNTLDSLTMADINEVQAIPTRPGLHGKSCGRPTQTTLAGLWLSGHYIHYGPHRFPLPYAM